MRSLVPESKSSFLASQGNSIASAFSSQIEESRPVAIFATLSLLARPCTEYPSVFNEIVGRCNVIISDEFTQVLQAKGLHLFRFQQDFREHQCLRFVLGDPKQLPAYALSIWNQITCMRGILSTQRPLSLLDQLCSHWNSTC